jgi:hypothetical protein
MIEAVEDSTKRLSMRRSHGRVVNAVAELLRKQLFIPEIYLQPRVPGAAGIDVLAVDRAGSGDIHGVEIKIVSVFPTRAQMREYLRPLREQPYHFKYLALPAFSPDLSDGRRFAEAVELFDDTGVGRFGIISFDSKLLHPSYVLSGNSTALTVRPERFKVRSEKLASIEKFLAKSKPDISVRV